MLPERRERYHIDRISQYGPSYAGFNFVTAQMVLNLVFTYDLLHQCTAKHMAEFGLSKSSFQVLTLLRHGPPEGMQLHDLGELLLVSRANITGLIDHLEEKGYVTREVDEQDRRARYAKVTKKAETLMDEVLPLHYARLSALTEHLSEADKNQLTNLLTKVRDSINLNAAVCERPAEANV